MILKVLTFHGIYLAIYTIQADEAFTTDFSNNWLKKVQMSICGFNKYENQINKV